MAHRSLAEGEIPMSTTYRELVAVLFMLQQMGDKLARASVLWRFNNQVVAFILAGGSMERDLQLLVCRINDLPLNLEIKIFSEWNSRENNVHADLVSKIYNTDSCRVSNNIFKQFNNT